MRIPLRTRLKSVKVIILLKVPKKRISGEKDEEEDGERVEEEEGEDADAIPGGGYIYLPYT